MQITNVSPRTLRLAVYNRGKESAFTTSTGVRCEPSNRSDAVRGLPSMWKDRFTRRYEGGSTPLGPGGSVIAQVSLQCEGRVRAASGALSVPAYVVVGEKVIPWTLSLANVPLR